MSSPCATRLIYTIPLVGYGLFLLHSRHAGSDTSQELVACVSAWLIS
ncbi:MAG TPA: hypothetical protein VFJ70_16860 [Burkholderiales bacterium]|nr:hypothetical protein [Burkholderiales bacterium]